LEHLLAAPSSWTSERRLSSTASTDSYWTPQSFNTSVEAWGRGTGGGASGIGWGVALFTDVGQTSGVDGWRFRIEVSSGGGTYTLRRFDNGQTPQVPADSQSGAPSGSPGYLLIRREGSSIEGWRSPDGTNWSLVVSVIDASFATTDVHLSLGIADNSRAQILAWDEFGGGALAGSPSAGQSYGVCDGSGTHAVSPSGCQQDPVNSLTGAFVTSATDLRLPGIGVPFAWRRTYTSSDPTSGRLGPGWTHSYATSLTVEADGDVLLRGDEGQQVAYSRQADGSFTGARGARSILTAVTGGYELRRKDQVVYRFDTTGRLLSMKDRNNQGVTLMYDESGQLQTISDSVGRAIAVTHTGGLLTRVTLPDGRYVEYSYSAGRLSAVRDAAGGTTQYTYDAAGRLETIVDQNAHTVVDNAYGSDGRVSEQTNARGKTGTFSWDAATQTQTYTDARTQQWKDVYAGNLLVRRVDPLGNTWRFQYDADLNVTRVIDARGNSTQMTYDARANVLTRTAPAPLSYGEVWTYNARNDPLTYRDRRGNTTDFGYDPAGNLTSVSAPDADGPGPLGRPVTLYGRDPAGTGLLVSITDPRAKTTSFTYTAGNLTEIRSALGNRTTLGYDPSGRLTSLVDPRGNLLRASPADYTWTYSYDELDRLEAQQDPLGHVTTLAYDPAGNLESRTDANGHETTYGYDEANELTSVSAPDPDGAGPLTAPVTAYTYDDVGNLASREDANLNETLLGYDEANRLNRITAPLGRVWTYGYDRNGNVTQVVDANGNATRAAGDGLTTYGYDVLDRLTSIDYAGTTPDVTLAYDGNDNQTQLTDGSGSETASYDPLDRLTVLTRGQRTITYGYDLVNLTSRTYPGMPITTYAYDDDERLSAVSWSSNVVSYLYDAAANLTRTTLPTGNRWEEWRTYDRAARLTAIQNRRLNQRTRVVEILSSVDLTLDPVGNPLTRTRSGTLDGTETYAYDALDRLTSVCYQAGTCPQASDPFIRYAYDGVGNRLSEARPSGTTTYTYNAADELTQAGAVSYTYDRNGNQLSAGARTSTWDLANRLRTTTLAGATTTYSYSGDGRRLQASTGPSPSQQTNYLWDPSFVLPQLAIESDGQGIDLRRYRHGLRPLHVNVGTSAVSYYHFDPLGSVVDLTSASAGALQWSYGFEPFGLQRQEQEYGSGQPVNLLKFAGEYLDPTGLHHLRARQYDTQTGRFLSRDPLAPSIAEPLLSSYAYVGNRPTVFVDPSGEQFGLPRLCSAGGCTGLCEVAKKAGEFGGVAVEAIVTHPQESLAVAQIAACVATSGIGCGLATFANVVYASYRGFTAAKNRCFSNAVAIGIEAGTAQFVTRAGVRLIALQRTRLFGPEYPDVVPPGLERTLRTLEGVVGLGPSVSTSCK
jgi:RHS repeat-associated protein